MTQPALIFLAGLAGSLHCVGMCGGFACAIGAGARGAAAASLVRHLAYNLGRVVSYAFIGALAGHAGAFLVELCGQRWGIAAQRVLALVSGALMVFIGLQFAGLLHHAAPRWPGRFGEALVQALRPLLRAPGSAAALALGAINGWLPCPLVYAFAAQAAAGGDTASGVWVMLWFGLGTFPAMLMMGGLGLWWRRGGTPALAGTAPLHFAPRWGARVWSVRLGGGFIVLLGLVTLARGLWPMSPHLAWH